VKQDAAKAKKEWSAIGWILTGFAVLFIVAAIIEHLPH